MKTIDNFNFYHKKALIRVDFNVPLDERGQVTDATRIMAAKPTILKILRDGGSAILMSHLGRPKGREEASSLRHILENVSAILGAPVKFASDCIGDPAEKAAASLQPGETLLLENLRFHPEEEKGDVAFSEKLAKLGDIYVNDAFGTAHRAHASTTIIAQFFPGKKCFGYVMASEIAGINKIMKQGEKPVTAILGGAKVTSKIPIIENILDKIDHLIIGGGMTYTFIKALGGKIGDSICETHQEELALTILREAAAKGVQVHLPVDVVIANAFSNEAHTRIVPVKNIPDGWQGLDIGPETLTMFRKVILQSKTILWNGPVGVFEMETFANGTQAIGNAIGEATAKGAFSLVGGGRLSGRRKTIRYGKSYELCFYRGRRYVREP